MKLRSSRLKGKVCGESGYKIEKGRSDAVTEGRKVKHIKARKKCERRGNRWKAKDAHTRRKKGKGEGRKVKHPEKRRRKKKMGGLDLKKNLKPFNKTGTKKKDGKSK